MQAAIDSGDPGVACGSGMAGSQKTSAALSRFPPAMELSYPDSWVNFTTLAVKPCTHSTIYLQHLSR